jgi:hypothetical protein
MTSVFLRIMPVVVLLFAAACTTTNTMQTTNEYEVAADARILVVEPDVELSFLKAAGLTEVRADWTETGKQNIVAEIERTLAGAGHELIEYEISADHPRDLQLVKLHEAVGNTILLHRLLGVPLPSKKDTFDWTLGPGVQEMAARSDADYALFLFARGQYASAGRQALAVGLAVVGVGGVSTGGQAAYASLVDLQSGDVVWFNVAQTGSGTDMRKPEGAAHLVENLMKDNPL